MSDPALIRQQFLEMMQRPEADIELARSALLVAAENDPALDVDASPFSTPRLGVCDATSMRRVA